MIYLNDNDEQIVAWLHGLIDAGLLSAARIDSRSIKDIAPGEVDGYNEAHFFAGIGGWPYALRMAGWPDGIRTWTGSCPCQPFSQAGRREGCNDPRHLWPAFRWLIAQCRPAIVFGEQVAGKDGLAWLAGVRADMEACCYRFVAADLCAAGIGAPHIRQRLFWCGIADGWSPHTDSLGQRPGRGNQSKTITQPWVVTDPSGRRKVMRVSDADRRTGNSGTKESAWQVEIRRWQPAGCRWILCRDKKIRRVPAESVLCRVADGVPERMDIRAAEYGFPLYEKGEVKSPTLLIRGFGNSIVPALAAIFIESVMEIMYGETM